ncbi:hypothetical protein B9G54_06075 [Alloscardovia macacae]|uniref:Helix-turn-helix domain-containing protein n=1 Tax=Alloscardovia macacae TaxID=1160091 RepID=A0A1Y2ST29_9BIFI|nr:helix-turn-helix domain-containing protein [Alloscardovia macacae]OTA26026.1 hypothetical protein B9G54_06075 [Alloscardovia macacae]OTA29885.1 hypothetical protein B9T39_02055 [Alloscardovia macacae]
MSMQAEMKAWKNTEVKGATKFVLVYLARCAAHEDGRSAWPSKNTIARACGCSTRTVQSALRELQEKGLIRVSADQSYAVYDNQAVDGDAEPRFFISRSTVYDVTLPHGEDVSSRRTSRRALSRLSKRSEASESVSKTGAETTRDSRGGGENISPLGARGDVACGDADSRVQSVNQGRKFCAEGEKIFPPRGENISPNKQYININNNPLPPEEGAAGEADAVDGGFGLLERKRSAKSLTSDVRKHERRERVWYARLTAEHSLEEIEKAIDVSLSDRFLANLSRSWRLVYRHFGRFADRQKLASMPQRVSESRSGFAWERGKSALDVARAERALAARRERQRIEALGVDYEDVEVRVMARNWLTQHAELSAQEARDAFAPVLVAFLERRERRHLYSQAEVRAKLSSLPDVPLFEAKYGHKRLERNVREWLEAGDSDVQIREKWARYASQLSGRRV